MKATLTKNYVSDADFREWVTKMNEQFEHNKDSGAFNNDDYTYVTLRSKVGVSKRNSTTDDWNSYIGVAYAWARCTGQPEYYPEKDKYMPAPGDWVRITIVNNKGTRYLKFIFEGITNYCFQKRNGDLILIDKNKITNLTYGE